MEAFKIIAALVFGLAAVIGFSIMLVAALRHKLPAEKQLPKAE